MIICYPVSACAKHLGCLGESIRKLMFSHISMVSRFPSSTSCLYFHCGHYRQKCAFVTICRSSAGPLLCPRASMRFSCQSCFNSVLSEKEKTWLQLRRSSMVSTGLNTMCVGLSSRCHNMSLRLSMPSRLTERVSKIMWSAKFITRLQGVSAGLIFGACVCLMNFKPVRAEAAMTTNNEGECGSYVVSSLHGKKVHTDYSITGIPGDGRCLFRSLAHGACLRAGKPSPNESLQRELADDLRARVADEFIKRRAETKWFVEGDFDTYVSQIRKPHVWGGEPELLMASHVLQMPITVYMHDTDCGGLIVIAEYGQEYGKENPIQVLYHGYGHYDALQIPGKGGRLRL